MTGYLNCLSQLVDPYVANSAHLCRPEIFKSAMVDSSSGNSQITTQENEELDSSDDDGLPPLEANTNRRIPVELQSATDSEDSDVEDS
ncbi:hypothetical protein Hanom_Chr14g01330591 [Helianthus anomalus]